MGRSANPALEQVPDPALQYAVGRPDRVADARSFEEFVDLGIGESCIAPEIQTLYDAPVARNYRLQHRVPAGGTMHITWPQRASLDIAELIEYEQRVIAGAAEMAIVSTPFLLPVGRDLARIHVKNDHPGRSPLMHLVDPLAEQIDERGKVLGPAEPLRLEAAHLAGRGGRASNRLVATQRIAGSRHSLSASFTSSYPASRPDTDWRSSPANRWRPFLPVRASASVSAVVSVKRSVSSSSR
jgi:hypothetical protein